MSVNWEWKEHFIFLNTLRDSGVTNMFGAAPYLQEHCDLDRKLATKVLMNWMQNFEQIQKELNE